MPTEPTHSPARSFTHFLTGVCAIIGGMFTGKSLRAAAGCGAVGKVAPREP